MPCLTTTCPRIMSTISTASAEPDVPERPVRRTISSAAESRKWRCVTSPGIPRRTSPRFLCRPPRNSGHRQRKRHAPSCWHSRHRKRHWRWRRNCWHRHRLRNSCWRRWCRNSWTQPPRTCPHSMCQSRSARASVPERKPFGYTSTPDARTGWRPTLSWVRW